MSNNPIVFYDGHCPVCHYRVRYVIKNDNKKQLYFASLQGEFAKNFSSKNNLINIDTVVFYLPEIRPYIHSEAIFELLKYLKKYTLLYYLLMITPSVISNILYKIVAKTRYMIFRRYDKCKIPSKEVLSRTIL